VLNELPCGCSNENKKQEKKIKKRKENKGVQRAILGVAFKEEDSDEEERVHGVWEAWA
jgi:hypothetical protein